MSRHQRNLAVIARDHLDPNKTTSVQKDSLKDIEEEVAHFEVIKPTILTYQPA